MFSSIIYGQGLFEIYKDKEEIDKKMNEIFLSNFHSQIEAKNDMPEVNMDYLPEDQFFPTDKLNEWMNDKLLFPTKIEGGILEYEHNMSPNQKSQVDQLFLKYEKAIATPTEPIGCFKLFQVSLNFLEGRKSHQAKRNIDWNKCDHEIKKMEKLGLIKENKSSNLRTLSNLVVIDKQKRSTKADQAVQRKEMKEGKALETPPSQSEQEIKSRYRLTCDLSDVNAIVQGNTRISLNKPEEIMEQINNCYMSSLDLSNFFWSFELSQESKGDICFYYRDTIMQFERLIQGLANSPWYAVLGGKMTYNMDTLRMFLEAHPHLKEEKVFKIDHLSKILLHYVDDILLKSPKNLGFQSHLHVLHYFLWATEKAGFKVSAKKSKIFTTRTKYLGLQLDTTNNAHFVEPGKLATFRAWPSPTCQAELLSRLATLNFYNKYVYFLKPILAPLIELSKNNERYKWEPLHEKSWNNLTFMLQFALNLKFPSKEDSLLLFTDSSILSCGFMLASIENDLSITPIHADSRLYRSAERSHSIVLKECYSMLYALKQCEKYIRQSTKEVLIFSDCSSLQYLKNNMSNSSKFFELSLLLTSFPNVRIVYLKGEYNVTSDILSRRFFQMKIQDTKDRDKKLTNFVMKFKNNEIEDGSSLSQKFIVRILIY